MRVNDTMRRAAAKMEQTGTAGAHMVRTAAADRAEKLLAFGVGALGYPCLEILARGWSHWTMALLGGACAAALVAIARRFSHWPLALQALLAAAVITAGEFATGLVVNRLLGWGVWDYSREFGSILGQICPLFSFLWFLLSLPALWLLRRVLKAELS